MNKDPKGYYAILGVSLNATAAEIKAAYRHRAKELHPDRNRASDASAQFRLLNEAYEELNDPASRATYDTMALETEDQAPAGARQSPPEPIVCSCCGKVTAQPRYAIFFTVKSFVLMTLRSPIQGIFCRACAEKRAYRASVVTWLLGWWGFPWGPIYSVHAIITNMLGGKRPPEVNARLAAYQAWCFATLGKMDAAPDTSSPPADEAVVAPGVWTKRFRQITPRCSGSQDPEDAIEDTTIVYPRNAPRFVRQHRLDGNPFMIGEFVAHVSSPSFGV